MNLPIIAIIPIKHNSVRVPGKNFRNFNGNPLYVFIVNIVLKSKYITEVIIDTNSQIVKDGINIYFKGNNKITVYDRPEYLCSGDTPMNDVLINVITKLSLKADFYVQTHTTNPLLTTETLDNAIELFIEKRKNGYDSLFSVKSLQMRLYREENNKIIALNHNPNELIPTQNLEPLYEENSCIYIFTKDRLIERNHRIGYNPILFKMNDIESQDIDTEYDFTITSLIHKSINEKNNNYIALITGVSGGIGIEIAKKFKECGWYIIGTSEIPNFESEYIDRYMQYDLTKQDSVQKIIENIKNKENRINCLINNAAIQICKPIWDLEEESWDKIFNCNLKTVYRFVKYGIDILKESQGNIINIGSVHAINTSDEIAAYACSKSAIVGLTRNLAIELGKFGIRVNSISPGAVNTPMLRSGLLRGHVGSGIADDLVDNLSKKHILGSVGKPEEIAELVYSINNNNFMTGSNIIIDGGATIKLSTE